MWSEFKKFIYTGNVIDFAISVILAGVIGAVVNGFVTDIMMPIIGAITGGPNFADMKHVFSAAEMDAAGKVTKPENAILYGKWITSIINLFITGFVLFMLVKTKNRVSPPPPPAPEGPTDNALLSEIRDLLKR